MALNILFKKKNQLYNRILFLLSETWSVESYQISYFKSPAEGSTNLDSDMQNI